MSSTTQPKWKLLANLGDATPLDYGGYFVFEDTTGVYDAEAELLEVPEENEYKPVYTVRRFTLARCTLTNGILSDNKFHPECAAWFAKPESERATRPQDTTYLSNVADSNDVALEELQSMFCSADVLQRAQAYRMVGEYHGFDNLDSYPLQLTRKEAKERIASFERSK